MCIFVFSFKDDPYKRVGLFDDSAGEEGQDADRTLQSVSDSMSLSDDSTFTGRPHFESFLIKK